MSVDAKKHQTVAAGEAPKRGALAAAILSINDAVPVANVTEQKQIATALKDGGADLAKTPLTTMRADAPALHRLEYTYDGDVFLPASGVLHFATESAANTWGQANSALLSVGDRCYVGSTAYVWQGTKWRLTTVATTYRASPGAMTNAQMAVIARVNLPAAAPAGVYLVGVSSISAATSSGAHYQQVFFGGNEITKTGDDRMEQQPANVDVSRSDSLLYTHGGGDAEVTLGVQVNASSPYLRAARLTVTFVG
ncbi:hypothetical protein [uncultured Microbacterium sp.]|uniref:hypothetical protein n=1 Tax=uncultured Microbacterium sp. TaxID=191216 RepID=UPI0025DB89B8|nr:hypothetical protein [uncultured Microbacterium sp.]